MSVNAIDTSSKRISVAYLGPVGTYTHQVAYDYFGESATYIEKDTIADTFKAVPSEASYCLLPKENSIFGSVVETYDLLCKPEAGQDKFIIEEVTLCVQHCLIVTRGTELRDIKRVLSHEQALGQCSEFLKENLPDAALVKMSSTAAAAKSILSDLRKDSAAICSEINASINHELIVLHKGIQNEQMNYTKFWIMSSSECYKLPNHANGKQEGPERTLLRFSPSILPSGHSKEISALLATLDIPVVQIDRRPSRLPVPFHNTNFLEIMGDSHAREDEDLDRWHDNISRAVKRAQDMGWDGCVLGHWRDHVI